MFPIFVFIWLVTIANLILPFLIGVSFTLPLPAVVLVVIAIVASLVGFRTRSSKRVKVAVVFLIAWLCILPFDATYYVHSIYHNITL